VAADEGHAGGTTRLDVEHTKLGVRRAAGDVGSRYVCGRELDVGVDADADVLHSGGMGVGRIVRDEKSDLECRVRDALVRSRDVDECR